MKIHRERKNKYDLIHIEGEINIARDAEKLICYIDDLIEEGSRRLVFDFSDIGYVFSGVIRILIQSYKRAQEKDAEIAIIETNNNAFKALDLVGITQLIKIYRHVEDLPPDFSD
ncbi:MAG: STAS domain-containing protein [Fibrobacterota bacterium]